VQNKTILKLTLLPLGIALLLAGLFFDSGAADSARLQAEVTPTPDRLAEPTLPASPSQTDLGAQVYWLSCMPCHGDRGQGLTDEFRAAYPPEEKNCWESGCHGANPYESGFTLPKKIPGVVGSDTLGKFSDAAQLNAYIRAAMPFWKPGSLTEDDAWRVTAFILRENDLWDDAAELNAANAAGVPIPRGTPIPVTAPQPAEGQERTGTFVWLAAIVLVIVLLAIFILKKSRNTTKI